MSSSPDVSSDAEPQATALTKVFGEHCLEVEGHNGSRHLQCQTNVHGFKKMQLFHGRYDKPIRVQAPNTICFMQSFPIRGNGRHLVNGIEMTSTTRKGFLAEPGRIDLSYGANFEHFVLTMDPDALSKTLACLIGMPISAPLKLDMSDYEARPETPGARSLVELLAAELENEVSLLSPLVVAELEQAILVAFLCGNRHNHSRLLESQSPNAGSLNVRRIEEYIEANWDQPITIEALALAASVSARSIFQSFKAHRGRSPMQFLKQVRLRRGREMLISSTGETTVTRVALACGFGNLGHFAIAYKKAFGEAPMVTLNRGRDHWHRRHGPRRVGQPSMIGPP
jgi:AraC-like DNA-binding protein